MIEVLSVACHNVIVSYFRKFSLTWR